MKKAIIVLALVMALTGTALASGGRPHKPYNLNILGSDDHQSKRPVTQQTQPVSVPEPGTLILLGAGIVGIAAAKRK